MRLITLNPAVNQGQPLPLPRLPQRVLGAWAWFLHFLGNLRWLGEPLRFQDLGLRDRLVLCLHRCLRALHLDGKAFLCSHQLLELRSPPPPQRGLRDLTVRRGTAADLPTLAALGDDEEALLRQRLDAGDVVFVGEHQGQVLCMTWFRKGPAPFEEDNAEIACWELGEGTYWSYAAVTRDSARASGVFAKVFVTALRELFDPHGPHGARRVLCRVRMDNRSSVRLHQRLGFWALGTVTSLGTSGALGRVVWFQGPSGSGRWRVRRGGALRLPVPPVAAAVAAAALEEDQAPEGR